MGLSGGEAWVHRDPRPLQVPYPHCLYTPPYSILVVCQARAGSCTAGAQLACVPGHTGSYLQMVKPRLARVGGGLLLSGSLSQLHKEPFLPPQALLHNNPGLLWPRFLSHLMCHLVTIAVIPGIASLTLGNSACCLAPSQTPGEIDRFGKIMATGGSWSLRLVSCVHGFL